MREELQQKETLKETLVDTSNTAIVKPEEDYFSSLMQNLKSIEEGQSIQAAFDLPQPLSTLTEAPDNFEIKNITGYSFITNLKKLYNVSGAQPTPLVELHSSTLLKLKETLQKTKPNCKLLKDVEDLLSSPPILKKYTLLIQLYLSILPKLEEALQKPKPKSQLLKNMEGLLPSPPILEKDIPLTQLHLSILPKLKEALQKTKPDCQLLKDIDGLLSSKTKLSGNQFSLTSTTSRQLDRTKSSPSLAGIPASF